MTGITLPAPVQEFVDATSDSVGRQAGFEVLDAEPGAEPDSCLVTVRESGNGCDSSSPITFQLHDGRINRLTITPS
ncbi:hypothetical protein ACWC4D_08045 [Streptomyces sp. NPDC001288]|uniref:hypothetical protein n=1 Tax=unclassified Streptomyces TaxID=2593676 RepID=UPI003326C836